MVSFLLLAAALAVCKPAFSLPAELSTTSSDVIVEDPEFSSSDDTVASDDFADSSSSDLVSTASADGNCQFLRNAGLGSLLLLPSDPAYSAREGSYWAPNAALGPQCIIQPRTTSDVSKAMKAITRACAKFAVRSGGHVQWAGGSDVKDGVTIDLALMSNVTFNTQTKVVAIQPGPRWGAVFDYLEPYGVGVTGGRDADVGIGGFLTGGGNAYLTARNGFGADTVVNFQVVLADGRVVNANKNTNADLFKGLKGGWANYGIVTRFDLETTPSAKAWGGPTFHDKSYASRVATALVNFTNKNSVYRAAAHLVLVTYNTVVSQDVGVITVKVDTTDVENAPIFSEISAIPNTGTLVSHNTLGGLAKGGIDPSDDRVHWFTLTFNNDVSIVNKAISLHDDMVAQLKPVIGAAGFSTQCVLQPIPSFFGEIGASKGGNVMGLDSVKTNSIMWLGTVAYKDSAFDQVAHDKIEAYAKSLETFAKSKNGNVQWRYINYSDKTQNPLKSYGTNNVNFIKKVASKYDNAGVFQSQQPGGFKISAI